MSRPPRIVISAGEASGDRLGAGLARALRERRPDVELVGMGGDEMAASGVRLVQHASEVAVVGFVEVIRHLPAIRRAMASLETLLDDERPELVVPVDFPDFNLRLAARAHARGIPVVYYVSPQVWAWRRGRVRTIRSIVRRMLVLFPFESAFYASEGVPVTFVGHPAAAGGIPRDTASLRRGIGLPDQGPVVALLPGSRRGEVTRHLPILLEAARLLRRRIPSASFVVPQARTLPAGLLEEIVAASRLPGVLVHAGDYPGVLHLCAAGAVASGTATLDAALAGLPTVVVYRMQALSYLLARRLVQVPHIALPNLVAGRRIFPELVQEAFTPEAVAGTIASWIEDDEAARRVRDALGELRAQLCGEGAFDRAAQAVLDELSRGGN
ncbi:MAG TPA: lipid-A-disaccharide synthase [Candidatus Polarisedimenticolaceae bacterium]